jgi:BTB/POZ domain-containing protein KCTD9
LRKSLWVRSAEGSGPPLVAEVPAGSVLPGRSGSQGEAASLGCVRHHGGVERPAGGGRPRESSCKARSRYLAAAERPLAPQAAPPGQGQGPRLGGAACSSTPWFGGGVDWMRKSLEDTWRYLESEGEETPRRADSCPFVHESMPNIDDEELGFHYYKYRLEDADNSNLTLPRTFFGRSWFVRVNFANTDLSESRMCWNEFDGCDFSGADLSRCDMRSSIFKGCRFVGTTLRGADFRRSGFEACDFTGADLTGTVAEDEDAINCVQDFLTDEQQAVMVWSPDEGPEAPGG